MKKRIFCFTLAIITLFTIFTTTAFAQTTTVVIKPEYTEDTVVAIDYKDGQLPGSAEYVYTGKKIMPAIIVTKVDKTIAVDISIGGFSIRQVCDITLYELCLIRAV